MNVSYDDGGASAGATGVKMKSGHRSASRSISKRSAMRVRRNSKASVTVRHRDSMEQERMPIDGLLAWLFGARPLTTSFGKTSKADSNTGVRFFSWNPFRLERHRTQPPISEKMGVRGHHRCTRTQRAGGK